MLAEFVQKILDIGKDDLFIAKDGLQYSRSGSFKLVQPPAVVPLQLPNLDSMLEFIRACTTAVGIPYTPEFIHVIDPWKVELVGFLRSDNTRHVYARATCASMNYPRGDLETFIIQAQTVFVQDEETARLLKLVGNIREETSKATLDDGVTQQVTVRTGVATVKNVNVINPFILRPYRTFREIDQPESPFLLRIGGSGKALEANLFLMDGDKWKDRAILNIKNYFMVEDGDIPTII